MIQVPEVSRRRGKPMDMRNLNRTLGWRKGLVSDYKAISARLLEERMREVVSCPICDGGELRPFVVIYGFPYAECAACGHLFCRKQPTDENVRRLYQELGEIRSAQATLYGDEGLFDRRVAEIARPKVEHVRSLVPADGLWLDVGCATGELLTAAKGAGWRVRGIEADPGAVDFARGKGFDVIHDFVRVDNAGQYVGDARVVSALNILEHMALPVEVVKAISSGMRPGTHVVIEVPRHPSLSSFAALIFPTISCRHLYAPEHLHIFTEQSMEIMLGKADLQPVSVWTFGQDFQELVSGAALAAGIDEGGFFQQVYDLAPRMQQAIDDADFSDVIFVVARKTSRTSAPA